MCSSVHYRQSRKNVSNVSSGGGAIHAPDPSPNRPIARSPMADQNIR
jgi:hypothetical protein